MEGKAREIDVGEVGLRLVQCGIVFQDSANRLEAYSTFSGGKVLRDRQAGDAKCIERGFCPADFGFRRVVYVLHDQ